MRIEYETNTLVIIVHDKNNLYLVYNTLDEIERLLCKKLDVEEIQSYFKVLSDKADKIYINMIDVFLKTKGD